jgi:hypothetical protein
MGVIYITVYAMLGAPDEQETKQKVELTIS